jgi:hypothetical protein
MEGTHLLLVVTRMALELARQVLPPYSHPRSPHQFTQPQLLACLIVKAYLRQSYRGIVELLALSDGLRQAFEAATSTRPLHVAEIFATGSAPRRD